MTSRPGSGSRSSTVHVHSILSREIPRKRLGSRSADRVGSSAEGDAYSLDHSLERKPEAGVHSPAKRSQTGSQASRQTNPNRACRRRAERSQKACGQGAKRTQTRVLGLRQTNPNRRAGRARGNRLGDGLSRRGHRIELGAVSAVLRWQGQPFAPRFSPVLPRLTLDAITSRHRLRSPPRAHSR